MQSAAGAHSVGQFNKILAPSIFVVVPTAARRTDVATRHFLARQVNRVKMRPVGPLCEVKRAQWTWWVHHLHGLGRVIDWVQLKRWLRQACVHRNLSYQICLLSVNNRTDVTTCCLCKLFLEQVHAVKLRCCQLLLVSVAWEHFLSIASSRQRDRGAVLTQNIHTTFERVWMVQRRQLNAMNTLLVCLFKIEVVHGSL